jgi:hypothetical protein
MPYKCLNCDKVVEKIDDQECDCESPKFMKCETIHFLHKDGLGKALATRKVMVGMPKKPVVQELKLACTSTTPSPIVSGYEPTVTCKDCLAFIESIQPAPEE